MMLASELPADMRPAVGDRCWCLRGKSPQLVTIVRLLDGGAYLYISAGRNPHDEFVVSPGELSYASYEDCEEWIAARSVGQVSNLSEVGRVSNPPTPETVQRAYTPPPAVQLSLFA